MNIIEHLNRTITPILLGSNSQENNQVNLLEKFYALTTARLADEKVYKDFENVSVANDDPSFFERLFPKIEQRESLIKELATNFNTTEQQAGSLATRGAPLILNELRSLAGTSSLPVFLKNHLSSLVGFIPNWALGFIPVAILEAINLNIGGLNGKVSTMKKETDVIGTPSSTAPTMQRETDSQAKKSFLPIIGLIILGALAWAMLRACQNTPTEPVATPPSAQTQQQTSSEPTQNANLTAPTLTLKTDADKKLADCTATVGDDTLKGKISSLISRIFGTEKSCNVNVDTSYGKELAINDDQLNKILALVKETPNAEVNLSGKNINVTTANPADGEKLAKDLQALFPDFTINLTANPNAEQPTSTTDGTGATGTPATDPANATGATDGTNATNANANGTTPATGATTDGTNANANTTDGANGAGTTDGTNANANGATPATDNKEPEKVVLVTEPTVHFENGKLKFYFATAKSEVAPDALEKAKEILAAAQQGKTLGISGFTDSTGNKAANEKLSRARAEAVKAFLVQNGVPEAQLQLVKPQDSVGAKGKNQEGRRVEVFIIEVDTNTDKANADKKAN